MNKKKIQYWIGIAAMVFLLIQSTIGLVTYFNKEEPTQRMEMTGDAPFMQNNSGDSNTNTDTASGETSDSTTSQVPSGDSGQWNNNMSFPNGMNGERTGQMDTNNVADLVLNTIGVIISLAGIVFTFLTFRKKEKETNETNTIEVN